MVDEFTRALKKDVSCQFCLLECRLSSRHILILLEGILFIHCIQIGRSREAKRGFDYEDYLNQLVSFEQIYNRSVSKISSKKYLKSEYIFIYQIIMNITLSLPPRSTFLVVLESGVAIIFMILALTGNLTVCLAISRNKLLRTVPNYLLLNLAVADILSAVVSFPLLISVLVNGIWGFHENLCQLQAFQTYVSYACSLLTLTMTSVTRYYATVHPVKHRGIFKVKTVCVLISVVWATSFAFAAMPLFGWGRYQFEPFYALCIHDHTSSESYNMFLFCFLIVNTTVIVTCYSKISKAMKRRNRQVHSLFAQGSSSRQLEVINAQEVKLTNTIFIVICLFAICYVPTIILGFLMFTPVGVPRFARMLSTFSVGLTTVVNPIVYWVRSKAFAKH